MDKSKTLVIPAYTLDKDMISVTLDCIDSYRKMVDTVIIVEDGGVYSEELRKAADIYVYSATNVGFTKTVNRGWKLSDADFTFIVNSDTYLVSGKLEDMCVDGYVTCPEIVNLFTYPNFTGCFWVVPKEVKEEYGLLNERLKNFESDMEYYDTTHHIFKKINTVKIFHQKGYTFEKAKIDVEAEQKKDAYISHNFIK